MSLHVHRGADEPEAEPTAAAHRFRYPTRRPYPQGKEPADRRAALEATMTDR